MNSIGVIGGGSWGTALSHLLAENGWSVDLWTYEEEVCKTILEKKENSLFLPGIKLSPKITPSNSLKNVTKNKELLFLVSPSHVIREVSIELAPHIKKGCLAVNAAKGIENNSLLTVNSILKQTLPSSVSLATISGPTFSEEIARRVPSAIVSASENIKNAKIVQKIISTPFLKVFTSTDILGVELGGALKNVIAVSVGIADGLKQGNNTRAALITRGLVEIKRIGTALGARPETFSGLTGMGDLVLTCTGNMSRNRAVGIQIGQGKKLADIISEMKMVAEGVNTVKSANTLLKKLGIRAAVIEETYQVLHEGKPALDALRDILMVETYSEFSGVKGLQ